LKDNGLKKFYFYIVFIFFAPLASASFANISTYNITKPYNFINTSKLTQLFNIGGTQFFSKINTNIPKKEILKYETLQPKIIKLPKIPATQTIWIINNGWTSTTIQQGNSIVTLE